MKQLFISLLILSTLSNCSRQEGLTIAEEIQTLADPPQFFTIKNNRTDTLLTKKGIRLIIPPNTFVLADDKAPDDSIRIEIKEIFDKSEMIFNQIGTTSDGRLLESYGMLWIDAISNQKSLNIGSNSSIKVSIPNKQKGRDGELFYGQEKAGILNWSYVDTKKDSMVVSETMDTIYKIENDARRVVTDSIVTPVEVAGYETAFPPSGAPLFFDFDLKNLGWINCDRFIDVNDKVTVAIELTNYSTPLGCLVLDSINSVMMVWFDPNGKATVNGLPRNYKAEVIVTDKIDGKVVWSRQRITTGAAEVVPLKPEPIEKEALEKQLEMLDKK